MNPSLAPYPAYRDSGLPWLDRLPEHWTIRRAKNLFRSVDVRSASGTEELLTVSSALGVVPRRSQKVTMFQATSYAGHKLCWPGDLVINSLWAWARGLGVSRHHGIVSTAYGVYRLRPGFERYARFLHELVRSSPFQWELQVRSKGVWTSRLQLTDDSFFATPIPLPPPDEQAAIVRYLDHVDRRIGRLIRAKQRLVALLEEEKQAIIHRAVTRGLDPHVRLKPSGVAWLGDIPEHWEVRPLKSVIGFQEGPGIMAADFRDSGTPLLRISCLRGEVATLDGCNYLDPATVAKRWSHFAVHVGDYLLSASGSLGSVARATTAVAGAIPYTGIIRIWAQDEAVGMEHVRYFMSSSLFSAQVSFMKAGVGIEHFGPTHLKRMLIVVPPPEEQAAIDEFLDSEASQMRMAEEHALREIALLREYRTRLIADVVTGKVDVRAAAAELPEEIEEFDDFSEFDTTSDDEDVMNEDTDAATEED